jgi:hypothetical protein
MALNLSISIAIDSSIRSIGGPTPPPANAIVAEDGTLILTEDSIIIITE